MVLFACFCLDSDVVPNTFKRLPLPLDVGPLLLSLDIRALHLPTDFGAPRLLPDVSPSPLPPVGDKLSIIPHQLSGWQQWRQSLTISYNYCVTYLRLPSPLTQRISSCIKMSQQMAWGGACSSQERGGATFYTMKLLQAEKEKLRHRIGWSSSCLCY